MAQTDGTLLAPDEPPAVTVTRPDGGSRYFLACDHAGRRIPRRLGELGLGEADLNRHIAWDIGAAAVAGQLSEALDAPLVSQTYSRLVIDCNRDPSRHDSIATISESTEIPGNRGLGAAEAAARREEVFRPYHDAIAGGLAPREATERRPILVCVHSFTPVYKGVERPWHIGLLYNRDDRMARVLHDLITADGDLVIGHNQPYAVSDESDYTVPVHGERRGLVHIEIEIRQDQVADGDGQRAWAARLERWLMQAEPQLAAL